MTSDTSCPTVASGNAPSTAAGTSTSYPNPPATITSDAVSRSLIFPSM
ncbi:MAG: hypothetical protein BWY76_03297 [bacterium ADurb.Bin429]|nr:MAG: hypothetical protein BWY76_03297 [bacterium ADurb.Bin429]